MLILLDSGDANNLKHLDTTFTLVQSTMSESDVFHIRCSFELVQILILDFNFIAMDYECVDYIIYNEEYMILNSLSILVP